MNENTMTLDQNTVFEAAPQSADAPRYKIIFTAALITAFLFTLCFKGADVTAGLSSVIFFNATSIGGLGVFRVFCRL